MEQKAKEVKRIIEAKGKAYRMRSGNTKFIKMVLQNKFFRRFSFWSSQNNLKKILMKKKFVTRDKKSFQTPGITAL